MPSKLLTIGLLVPALLGSLSWVEKTLAQSPSASSRREVYCSLEFSDGLRSGRCILETSDTVLTATILENEDEPIEGAAGNLLRQRRRANRPSENVKVDIPVSDIFSLNYQIWNEVSGGFLIPDSLVNVDYSVVEVGFLAPPTAERPNLTNHLKIATSVEFGAGFAEQLTSATADVTAQPIEVLFRAGVMSGRPSAIDAATTQSLVAEVAAEQVAESIAENIAENITENITEESQPSTTPSPSNPASRSQPYPDTTAQVRQLLDTNACVRCDLRGADLEKADLDRANLEGANLEGANLTRAELNRAYLVGANLEKAILTKADLDEANLIHASLAAANLTAAKFVRANLTGASLQSANLAQASLAAPTLMSNANLKDANLSGALLMGSDLSGANLENANLEGANLRDFFFTYTPSAFSSRAGQFSGGEILVGLLVGTDQNKTFRFKTNLNGANLSSANLSQSNLKDATIVGANFSNANLSDADLEDVDLTSGNFCGATLPDGSRSEQGC